MAKTRRISINELTNQFSDQLRQRKEKLGEDSITFNSLGELMILSTQALDEALKVIRIDNI